MRVEASAQCTIVEDEDRWAADGDLAQQRRDGVEQRIPLALAAEIRHGRAPAAPSVAASSGTSLARMARRAPICSEQLIGRARGDVVTEGFDERLVGGERLLGACGQTGRRRHRHGRVRRTRRPAWSCRFRAHRPPRPLRLGHHAPARQAFSTAAISACRPTNVPWGRRSSAGSGIRCSLTGSQPSSHAPTGCVEALQRQLANRAERKATAADRSAVARARRRESGRRPRGRTDRLATTTEVPK